ncbi:MAG TPA: YggS family pyridoxal phosphate-dependent enzyme, partial [Candidatus Brevibacterium intestinigallinarum]|nr:YggS family pyridoxal phosphate-dependent enzyme [Candidatus Brevibacterium intestinigallinarum]
MSSSDEGIIHHDDYSTSTSVKEFRDRLAQVRAKIATAAQRAGRDPHEVRLLPVSKTVPEDRIRL